MPTHCAKCVKPKRPDELLCFIDGIYCMACLRAQAATLKP